MSLKSILFVTTCLLLIASRLINLEYTARFIWDESSDLVNMHQIWKEKSLTLIGPISEDGNKVFGSLTYYMLLPFTIAGNFHPLGPVYGSAFFGILTSILLFVYLRHIQKINLTLSLFIPLVWNPLLVSSRWAWNPNLIPFWVILSLLLIYFKKLPLVFLGGMALGLSVHHHYLSLISIAFFASLYSIKLAYDKQYLCILALISGLLFSLLPFVLFDLLHPPGLFTSRILYFNQLSSHNSATFQLSLFEFLIPNEYFAIVMIPISIFILIKDIQKNRLNNIVFGLTATGHLILITQLQAVYDHYLYPMIIFFILWLLFPRKGVENIARIIAIIMLTMASIAAIPNTLTSTSWEGDIATITQISEQIALETKTRELKNTNILVIGSPDPNIYGRRYRDLLLIKDKAAILSKDEYSITDNLFVISFNDEAAIRIDPAIEMNGFRNGPILKKWTYQKSQWKMYLFNRDM